MRLRYLHIALLCLLLGLVALSQVGCATSTRDLLPPRFEVARDAAGSPLTVSIDHLNRVSYAVLRLQPTMDDSGYHIPTHEWMERFQAYLADRRNSLAWHGRLVYSKDWPDCDDFAKLAVAAALLANDGSYAHPPLLGTIDMLRSPSFTGPHQLLWYLTDRGLFLYEPQTGEDWQLATLAELTTPAGVAVIRERLRTYGITAATVAQLQCVTIQRRAAA